MRILCLCLAVLGAAPMSGQSPYSISTVAGQLPDPEATLATEAILAGLGPIAVAPDGALHMSASREGRSVLYTIDAESRIQTRTGGTMIGLRIGNDGTAYWVAGGSPSLYIQDTEGKVRVETPQRFGPFRPQRFTSIALDSAGNVIVTDEARYIHRWNPTRGFEVVAGLGSRVTLEAIPERVAVGPQDTIYFWQNDRRIVKLNPDGTLVTVAGNRNPAIVPIPGVPATESPLFQISGIAVNQAGEVIFSHSNTRQILKINAEGILEELIAGVRAADVSLGPDGVVFYRAGGTVFRLGSDGPVVVAGRDQFQGDGGPATAAVLNGPTRLAFTPAGDLLVLDSGNVRIRRIDGEGLINTVAGNGSEIYSPIGVPTFMVVDGESSIYISGGASVRRLRTDGTIETIAGSDTEPGDSGDGGPATEARFTRIAGLAIEPGGSLLVSDAAASRIRRIGADGYIRTILGGGPHPAGSDGLPADQTEAFSPSHIAVDAEGNILYIENNTLRKISTSGILSTLGRQGLPGTFADEDAGRLCFFSDVRTLAFRGAELLYANSKAVCALAADGTIRAVAGHPQNGFTGDDGPALGAKLAGVSGLAVDRAGNIYFSDPGNHRVRKLTPAP